MKWLSVLLFLAVQPLLAAAFPVSDSESSPDSGALVVAATGNIPALIDGRTAAPDLPEEVHLESTRPYFWDLLSDRPIVKHLDFDTEVVDERRPAIQNGPRAEDNEVAPVQPNARPRDLAVRAARDPDTASDNSEYPRFNESEYSSSRPEFRPTCTRRYTNLWTRREWEIRWDGDLDPNGFNNCGERVLWALMERFFCLPLKGTWECKRIKAGHGGEGQVVAAFVTGAVCRHKSVERAVLKGTDGRVNLQCTKW
jgi:hypothetical protein